MKDLVGPKDWAGGIVAAIIVLGATTACQGSDSVGPFTSVAVGNGHACALDEDGKVVCWGSPLGIGPSKPAGRFVQVSVGAGRGGAVCEQAMRGGV